MQCCRKLLVTLMGFCLLSACGSSDSSSDAPAPEVELRNFYMGFTPWQYEATVEAQTTTYDRLAQHGDIIKHHLLGGIPWPEAYAQTAYHPNLEAEINGRLSNTPQSMTVFLAIDSLNTARDALAPYWQSSTNMPLPDEWADRTWSSPEVITAYINYASDMIDRFQPRYFEYGTEASELILNDSAAFDDYLIFAENVYTELKQRYPELTLLTSVALKSPESTAMQTIASRYDELLAYTDLLGVSVYPYVFFDHDNRGNPDNLPDNWLSQISDLSNSKPIAISETGWIGEDLSIPEFQYSATSNPTRQNDFVIRLLTESQQMNAEFVIWWTITDFDALWNDTLGQDPLAKIWKDIGFYDEDQMPRSGLESWTEWLEKERQ